jgi:hypothetical protein
MNIPEWAIGLVATALLAVIGWGVRRLMEGQEAAVKELGNMSIGLTKVCGHIDTINERASQDRGVCDERHTNNAEEHRRFIEQFDKMRF